MRARRSRLLPSDISSRDDAHVKVLHLPRAGVLESEVMSQTIGYHEARR